ncbi:MAG: hypothetical protein R3Y35_11530 [Clostridia bacterium]
MKYKGLYITTIEDVDENKGGYYCQVYGDEELDDEKGDFCIHPNELEKNSDIEYWIKVNIDADFIQNAPKQNISPRTPKLSM